MGVSENALQIYFVRNHVPYFLQFCYYPITMNGANPVPNGSPLGSVGYLLNLSFGPESPVDVSMWNHSKGIQTLW